MGERIRFNSLLREAALAPERREVEVVCIRPGLSRNGNYYGQRVLEEALPLFEGARSYIDHSGETLRSVRDVAGTLRAPRIGPDGELRATMRVSKANEWLWPLIVESVEEGTNLVGLSIDVSAQTHAGEVGGRTCRIVEGITRLHSCDVITRASAGGRFEKLLEADKQSWWDQREPANELAAELAQASLQSGVPVVQQQAYVEAGVVNPIQFGPSIAQEIPGGEIQLGGTYVGIRTPGVHGTPISAGEPPSTAAPMAPPPQLTDSSQFVPQTNSTTLREGEQAAGERVAEAASETARLLEEIRRERQLVATERLLEAAMRASGLPEVSRRRIERECRGRVLSEAEIGAAVAAEREYLGAILDADPGRIRGMGYERGVVVGMSEADRLQKAFDQLFDIYEGEKVPALTSIREAYVAATGDVAITGMTDPSRLQEADITTASFTSLLGTSMNKRLLKDYQAWPSEWQKFVTITPIKDFKTQTRVRLGAFGSLSTVNEDTAYTTITLADTAATYAPTKKGNLVAVTRETIINDDLYAIKQIPGKLAVSAAFTLAEFIYQTLLLANGAAIYDTFKLFDSINHLNTGIITANLGTPNSGAALASSALQTAVTKMRRQLNLANKPIGLKPRFLLVPPELEFTAMTVVKSAGIPGSNNNDINPMLGYCEVVVAPQIASTTYWVAVADPRVIDTIEIGFVGGQMNPQLFIQDQPLFGNNFTNDVITYKVRHEYGGAVVDYRGFYLGNN